MKQFPLFVQAGDDHVASVLTVPEGNPRGVVISLSGTGRHSLIGSAMCAHLSQRLVEGGLAHVRLDYAGVGDSPGSFRPGSCPMSALRRSKHAPCSAK